MSVTVTHQKPSVLDPVHTISCKGAYDPITAMRRALIDPLLTPLTAGIPVSIVDSKTGTNIDADDLEAHLLACLGDSVNQPSEALLKDVYSQSLVHYSSRTPLLINEVFAVQAGEQNKLPAPGPAVLYTAQADVIPTAKGLLAGSSSESAFFASISYTYHPNMLGVWFETSQAFTDFQTWLGQQVQMMNSVLPGATNTLFADFMKLTLKDLTESILLRQNESSNNEEYSFARLLVHFLMQYVSQQQTAAVAAQAPRGPVGVMPFAVNELFCPTALVFVNVEAHARANPAAIDREWRLINQSLVSPVKVVSNKAISKLTSLSRASAKAKGAAASGKQNGTGARSGKVVLRKKAPRPVDIAKDLLKKLSRMKKVNHSQNVLTVSKTSFSRANRRDPLDFNKPGRSIRQTFIPDLHVYIDTSGSISEANYQGTVMMLISIAKKLNVNLYFNSFSHILSQEVMLKTANKSQKMIWEEFRRVPKVNGGTNFQLVWDYINASAVRKKRLSLMITDFEWGPGTQRIDHPKNLYYAPVADSNWSYLRDAIEHFTKDMRHIDPAIQKKLIGVTR